MVHFKLWAENHPLILHNINTVLKFQHSTQISSSFYHMHLNEYDAAETNVVLTEQTFVFSPVTHH